MEGFRRHIEKTKPHLRPVLNELLERHRPANLQERADRIEEEHKKKFEETERQLKLLHEVIWAAVHPQPENTPPEELHKRFKQQEANREETNTKRHQLQVLGQELRVY